MKSIHLITVGTLKEKNLLEIEAHYLKQLKTFKLQIHEVKTKKEELNLEALEIIKKIDQIKSGDSTHIVLLMEEGKEMDSPQFSKWLYHHLDGSIKNLILVIGGASGFGNEIINISKEKISLSRLTFPHKIARILLIEQLYRAQTIKEGHPYHK